MRVHAAADGSMTIPAIPAVEPQALQRIGARPPEKA
jgi:hypothetical protein